MSNRKLILAGIALLLMAALSIPLQSKEENDVAVPAMNDFALVDRNTPMNQGYGAGASLREFAITNNLKPFDLNQDLQLNEFDAKQFQAIVESLAGEELTADQIASKFREKQEHQRESFLMIYDLNRDGRFTFQDVELFSGAVNLLDERPVRGDELIYKFREKIFPPDEANS